MKKNNTAEKTILDAEEITKALKESTEKSLRNIINEAISNMIKDGEEDDTEEVEDDSYEEEDVPTTDTQNSEEENPNETPTDGEEDSMDDEEGSDEETEDEDDWSDFEDYKVGDNDYDFTGVDGETALKVYNKLGDDDKIFVKKEDDGTYSVKDDETGAEFVIELDPEALDSEADEENFDDSENLDFGDNEEENEFEVELDGAENADEDLESDDSELEIDLGDEENSDDEIEIDLNDDEDEDSEELNEENLGYTDSYQKDVFAKKFNMNEPADSKTTNDWDNGVPKTSQKPWAGKGNMKPFEKKINECGDNVPSDDVANLSENGSGKNSKRRMTKGNTGINNQGQGYHEESKAKLEESFKKILNAAKQIQAENKEYKNCINKIKGSLYEAAVLNVNLGKLVDILVNETTTKEEKKRICERFNNVKTINEGKALYNAIKSELKESKAASPVVDKQFIAESKTLNETKIYQNSNDPSIDLMNRMDNLYK